ncbi:class I adenylate-forming enzyme family protein [Novosphingobium panipatense]|uniref:Acyl-CoA synthetase (AMP-forming)/AMP-acid ligase II n=1 Tax=Novosphingobium panipatense TaxID=428991 RepID=A0ABY1Q5V4_9SPHN|nr:MULTISPECIES: class I adenylate-forming enzyme family protein [Novosphingobium]SMP60848.1 Acyl-CoA synthetase (AMP-forming)/AMP-acid ligase II [Novosphingobium panipatense]
MGDEEVAIRHPATEQSVDGVTEIDPIFTALTAPGAPFAIGERDGIRQFLNAPSDLNQMIERARAFGDRTFIVEEGDDGRQRRLSFEQVFAWRDQLVSILGIARGDRVAICMRNRTEWIVAFLAVLKAGGVAAVLNSRGAPAELVAMIDDVGPRVVVADTDRARLIRAGGYSGRLLDLTRPFEDDVRLETGAEPLGDLGAAAPGDPCAILFTSGTTGRVKGAVLTHRSIITGLMGVQLSGMQVLHSTANAMGMPVDTLLQHMPQQAALLVYPLFHISGLGSAFLSPMLAGAKVVIMRRWDAQDAMRLMSEEAITMFSSVPTMLWDVLQKARGVEADLSSIRNIGVGGQALPVNLLDEIRAVCPQAMMGTGYGMTECSGAIAQAVGHEFVRKPSSAGRVLPLVDIRIEGPDGTELPAGEVGEIVLRGAQIMQGYWNRPEETAAVLSPDGWLRTGDIGLVDEERYVFIVDRKKDMVISGGENIYCAEVERALGSMPQVSECAAFGIPDDRLGELLVMVVRAEGVCEADVITWIGERLARYKAPGRVVITREPLPRNDVSKVDKVALRKAWPTMSGGK